MPSINSKLCQKLISGLILSLISLYTTAQGGVSLGATRMVFPLESKEENIVLMNSTKTSNFLISSWVENEMGEKTKDFIVTPPIYVSEPSSENLLRVIKIKSDFDTDKETLYFLNVKSIPSVDKESFKENNILQLAVVSRIKIFVRPKNLEKIDGLETKLELNKENGKNYIYNPTPYFMNMANIHINGKKADNITLSPFSKHEISGVVNKFSFQLVNDFGGLTLSLDLQ